MPHFQIKQFSYVNIFKNHANIHLFSAFVTQREFIAKEIKYVLI